MVKAGQVGRESGVTLVELIIVIAIVGVLAMAAVPVANLQIKRNKEALLRRELWEMRDAIDRYKDAADKNSFQSKADSGGYPPDLQTLVDGVDVATKKVRFLRQVPVDPMTGKPDWGTSSIQDDPPDADGGGDAGSGSGDNVFDVHSKSTGTALNGTKYSTW